jgi:hypothetical protein
MATLLDILRGLAFYVLMLLSVGFWGWLLLSPFNQDTGRGIVSLAGGGALLLLILIIVIANARITP